MIDLKQLQAMGAISDRSLVKKTITCRNPEDEENVEHTFDIFIRRRSSADSIEALQVENRLRVHVMVWRCVVDDKGEQVFPTIDDVVDLKDWLFMELFKAVNEVNKFTPKSSPLKTSSGARSRSDSGVEASRNGRKPSRQRSSKSGLPSGVSTAP